MRYNELMQRAALLLVLLGCSAPETRDPRMPRVRVAPDGRGFQLVTGQRFTPWGFNYDHDDAGRLLEDYWETEWPRVEEDFREMCELGATVVRIHLQLNRFMKNSEEPNEQALARLGKLLALAESAGLYLDLTGLGCYRKSDTPDWYESAQENVRWPIQARFWDAVSATCAKSPAVLCYNLMNEPLSPAGPGKIWHGGEPLGGYYYVEFLTQDPGMRSRAQVTKEWIATVSAGIRKNDPGRCVTAGMFFLFDRPGSLTLGPDPNAYGSGLDYLSIHMYPRDATVDDALKLLATLPSGKPVILEEMFPLGCSMPSFRRFVSGSRDTAAGWIGFYWGKTLEESRASGTLKGALVAQWLEYFRSEGPNFKRGTR